MSRHTQLGLADGLPALLLVAIYGLGALMIGGFIATFAIPALLPRGRARTVSFVLVTAFWGAIGYWKIIGPELTRDWERSVHASCESEFGVAEDVDTEGFATESASLPWPGLMTLFTVHGMSYIEIKVAQDAGQGAIIAHPNGDHAPYWKVSTTKPWVRLELADGSDPECAAPPITPRAIGGPPFMPGTCWAVRPIDGPTARYLVQLDPANRNLRRSGQWKIVDRETLSAVRSMVTVNPPVTAFAGSELGSNDRPTSSTYACAMPYRYLLSLFSYKGANLTRSEPRPHRLGRESVQAHPLLAEVLRAAPDSAVLQPQVRDVATDGNPDDLRFAMHRATPNAWPLIIDVARQQGFASNGPQIVDWSRQKIITFDPGAIPPNSPVWPVQPLGEGFIAWSPGDWQSQPTNRLARYRYDGSLDWAVTISTPSHRPACKYFWPDAIYSKDGLLVLSAACQSLDGASAIPEPGKRKVQEWVVPLSALPAPVL